VSRHCLSLAAAVVFAVASAARTSEATTITFDSAIIGTLAPDDAGDPFDNCVGYCAYLGTPGNQGVLSTQGFRFIAQTNNSGTGDQSEAIVVNPNLIPGVVDNGTDYLLAGGIVQMTATDNSPFSLLNFQAARIDPSDPTVGQFVRAFAFRSGVFFEGLHFDLSAGTGFQTFVLPSTWTGLSSVNFSGRLLSTDAFPRVTAIDNINAVSSVPEPASLVLLGTGILGLGLRRYRRRLR
jgi:PEP-CTERM motif